VKFEIKVAANILMMEMISLITYLDRSLQIKVAATASLQIMSGAKQIH